MIQFWVSWVKQSILSQWHQICFLSKIQSSKHGSSMQLTLPALGSFCIISKVPHEWLFTAALVTLPSWSSLLIPSPCSPCTKGNHSIRWWNFSTWVNTVVGIEFVYLVNDRQTLLLLLLYKGWSMGPRLPETEISGRAEVTVLVPLAMDVTEEGRCLPLERNEVWFQMVLGLPEGFNNCFCNWFSPS